MPLYSGKENQISTGVSKAAILYVMEQTTDN